MMKNQNMVPKPKNDQIEMIIPPLSGLIATVIGAFITILLSGDDVETWKYFVIPVVVGIAVFVITYLAQLQLSYNRKLNDSREIHDMLLKKDNEMTDVNEKYTKIQNTLDEQEKQILDTKKFFCTLIEYNFGAKGKHVDSIKGQRIIKNPIPIILPNSCIAYKIKPGKEVIVRYNQNELICHYDGIRKSDDLHFAIPKNEATTLGLEKKKIYRIIYYRNTNQMEIEDVKK